MRFLLPPLAFTIFVCNAATLWAAAPDPLFERMQGQWHATGERIQSVSGRKVTLEAHVTSETDEMGRLVSKNLWTEISEDGTSKQYERAYWIRPKAKEPGFYDLGMANDSSPIASGALAHDTFTVEQVLHSSPPLRVHSVTRFSLDAEGKRFSETLESVFWGERQISEAKIQFVEH